MHNLKANTKIILEVKSSLQLIIGKETDLAEGLTVYSLKFLYLLYFRYTCHIPEIHLIHLHSHHHGHIQTVWECRLCYGT